LRLHGPLLVQPAHALPIPDPVQNDSAYLKSEPQG
jgi:hypothetical protein